MKTGLLALIADTLMCIAGNAFAVPGYDCQQQDPLLRRRDPGARFVGCIEGNVGTRCYPGPGSRNSENSTCGYYENTNGVGYRDPLYLNQFGQAYVFSDPNAPNADPRLTTFLPGSSDRTMLTRVEPGSMIVIAAVMNAASVDGTPGYDGVPNANHNNTIDVRCADASQYSTQPNEYTVDADYTSADTVTGTRNGVRTVICSAYVRSALTLPSLYIRPSWDPSGCTQPSAWSPGKLMSDFVEVITGRKTAIRAISATVFRNLAIDWSDSNHPRLLVDSEAGHPKVAGNGQPNLDASLDNPATGRGHYRIAPLSFQNPGNRLIFGAIGSGGKNSGNGSKDTLFNPGGVTPPTVAPACGPADPNCLLLGADGGNVATGNNNRAVRTIYQYTSGTGPYGIEGSVPWKRLSGGTGPISTDAGYWSGAALAYLTCPIAPGFPLPPGVPDPCAPRQNIQPTSVPGACPLE